MEKFDLNGNLGLIDPNQVQEKENPDTKEEQGDFIEIDGEGNVILEESQENNETQETQETVENNQEDNPPSQETSSSSSPFSSLLGEFVKGGIIQLSDEEMSNVKDGETLISILQDKIRGRIDETVTGRVNEYDEDIKDIVAARDAGVNMSEYKQLKSEIFKLDKISDSDLEGTEDAHINLQKAVIQNDFKERGYTEEDITSLIESYEDTGKLSEKAKSSKSSSIERRKKEAEQRIKEAEAEKKRITESNEAALKNYEKYLANEIEEIIPGVKVSQNDRQEIFKLRTEVVDNVGGNRINALTQKRLEDPDKFDTTLAYLVHLGVFDGKFDKIVKTSKSKAMTNIENALSGLQNESYKTQVTPQNNGNSNESFHVDKINMAAL